MWYCRERLGECRYVFGASWAILLSITRILIAGLKYYTSKLATFDDLSTVRSFGFRGEALSSLCALCDSVTVMTATSGPMGIQLELEHSGKVAKKTKVARQVSLGQWHFPVKQ